MSTGSEDLKCVLVFISSLIPRFSPALSKKLLNVSARVESLARNYFIFIYITRLILEI